MDRLVLNKIQPPPPYKTGWPWTEESKPFPSSMANGKPWPKISIVTPSYNQGDFIEETIRSVLLQDYPDLEYIVIDGGSADMSVEIIKKYEKYLHFWVSEKDDGQADAIVKGFLRARGEILFWLNADDYLLPNALQKVGRKFAEDQTLEFVIGGGRIVDKLDNLTGKFYSFPQTFTSLLSIGQFFMQTASFWRAETYRAVNGIDTSLKFCFDYDLFLRFTQRKAPGEIDSLLAAYRVHEKAKSSTIWESVGIPEFEQVRKRHGFHLWSNAVCEEMKIKHTRIYHLNNRKGRIKDLVRDPMYFCQILWNKLKGETIEPLRD
jgi:glycosyltransferase involved in cell wall biosynthesis